MGGFLLKYFNKNTEIPHLEESGEKDVFPNCFVMPP